MGSGDASWLLKLNLFIIIIVIIKQGDLVPTYAQTLRHTYTRLVYFLLYGCETWTVTKTLAKCLDAFDTWCLWKILRIPYTRHTTNDTVWSITACSPVSGWVKSLAEFLWGHLARTAPRSTITVSLPPHSNHLPIGGGPLGIWELPGWGVDDDLRGPDGLEEGKR